MSTKTKQSLQEKLNFIQVNLNAPKNLYNNFGKYSYRNTEGILAGVKPLLKETNCTLTISDTIIEVGGRVYVRATASLNHESESISVDGWAREEENKKGMDASQLTGATSSYARKYALNGLFAIDDTVDADGYNTHGKDEVVKPSTPKATTPTKAKLTDLAKVKTALKNNREATIELLNTKYDLTQEQRKELGI
jgi:hypothetical protein